MDASPWSFLVRLNGRRKTINFDACFLTEGINARELSRKTKIPPSTLSSLMAGGKPQKLDHILALAEYFGTSMEMLLYGSDRRPPSLDEVLTEGVFSGWLKVEIKRAIPDKRKVEPDEE